MSRFRDQEMPDDLREVEDRLRAARPSFTDVELDDLKLRAIKRGSREAAPRINRIRGIPMRRLGSVVVTLVLAVGFTAVLIATHQGGNASAAQYCNGTKCSPNLVITACTKGGSNGQMTVSGTTDDTVAADLITLTFTASGQTTITDSFAPSASWSHTTGGMATNTFYDVTASQTSANGTTTYSSTTAGLSCKTK